MVEPKWKMLLASIKRCDAVYGDPNNLKTAFEALGCAVLGVYYNDGHQAVVHRDPEGWATITICGTRVSCGTMRQHAVDLFEDIDFSPVLAPGGGLVAAGALDGLDKVFAVALDLFLNEETIRVEGHSLGAQRAHLAPLFIPLSRVDRIIAWEPPKAADDEYYGIRSGWFSRTLTILNGKDPWAAWSWTCQKLKHPPGPIVWLHDGTYDVTTRDGWPGGEILHSSDHFSNLIVEIVEKLSLMTAETTAQA